MAGPWEKYQGNRQPAGPIGPFPGQVAQGNIDLRQRPVVHNPDGSISTVRSMSFGNDQGQEVLVPTVSPDGRILSDRDAIDLYRKTGQSLGVFDNPQDADRYATALHEAQARYYGNGDQGQSGPWAKYAQPAPTAPQSDVLSRLENSGDYGGIRAATGNFLEGIPVVGPALRGGAERIAAGIIAAGGPETYGETLEAIQRGGERNDEAHPATALGSQLAGGIAGTLPLVAAAPAAFGAGSAGIVGRSLASAASGAALGGADSAVRSGDLGAALRGAEWGAGLGLFAPGVGSAVGAGTRALTNRLGTGVSRAERAFGRAAGADAIDNPVASLASAGDQAMPMDLGPNLQRQAGALAATPGRGQEIVRSAISDRQGQAGQRVAGALDSALGRPADTIARAEEVIARRAAQAKPLYAKAYEEGSEGIMTPEIQRMASSPMFGDAMRQAATSGQDRAVLEGFGSFNPRVTITQDGRILFNQTKPGGSPLYPDLQYWDYVKRNLDDMASSAGRAGRNEQASVARSLASRLRGELDRAVPSYKAARDAYAGESAILEAMEEGQKAFRNNMTPNQMRTRLMKMSDAEKEAYVEGARAQIADMMGTARNDALKVRGEFQKGYNKEKLGLLIGKEQAERLLNALDSETSFARTRDVVTGNSETAARLAAQADVGAGGRGPGILEQAGNLNFGTAAMRMLDKGLGGIRGARQNAANEELARLLTSRDPKAISDTIKRVQAAQRRGDISAQRSKEIIQGLILSSRPQHRPLELTVTPNRVP